MYRSVVVTVVYLPQLAGPQDASDSVCMEVRNARFHAYNHECGVDPVELVS